MSTVHSTTVLDKLRTRGHWFVVIRPATFEEERVRSNLFGIVDSNSVE